MHTKDEQYYPMRPGPTLKGRTEGGKKEGREKGRQRGRGGRGRGGGEGEGGKERNALPNPFLSLIHSPPC